jgi:exonuclease III
MDSNCILVWNVQSMNSGVRHNVVWNLVVTEKPSIACLQETKLCVCTDYDVIQILGHGFDYFCLPAEHTRGGILLAW